MMAYAYQSLKEAEMRWIEVEEFNNIHDLMAAILMQGVSHQIKQGLNRDYISQTKNLRSLHGKIDITNSIKQCSMLKKQMVCHYDLFLEDTLLNRILKTTMLLLIRCGDVKQENRKSLRKLLLYFENVGVLSPYQINWNAINYHRNNSSYKMLTNVCRLVIKGLLITTDSGEYKLAHFFDDQQMHRLYEKFVLEYLKKEYPQYSVGAAYIDWNVDDGVTSCLPVMKSDITLTNGVKTLIIDTKYYSRTMQANPMYNSCSIISDNLYQIFTYVKNKDRTGSGNVSGVLLYAKTDEDITPDNDYRMAGNHISVKTLDLGADWSDIERQLAAVASLIDM